MFGAIEKIQRRRSYSLERLWWREWGRGGKNGSIMGFGGGGFSPPAAAIVAEWQCGAIVCSGALSTRNASLKFATRYTRKTRHSAFNPATVPMFESALWVSGRAILSGGRGGVRWLPPSLPRHPEIKIHSEMRDENVSFVFFFCSIFLGASSVRIPSAPCASRPHVLSAPPSAVIRSDVWYRSAVSVTRGCNASLPEGPTETPHISHITSLKSFIPPSVLRDLTQWLFMPRDPARVCVCAPVHAWVFKVRSAWASVTREQVYLCSPRTPLPVFLLPSSSFFQHAALWTSASLK